MYKSAATFAATLLLLSFAAAAAPDVTAPDVTVILSSSVLRAFKDCDDCPEMAQIPAGSIVLGSAEQQRASITNQQLKHRVNIGRYALSKTEITNAQFAAFVQATHYQAGNSCWTFENGSFEQRADRNWQYPGFPQEDDHAATCLNIADINAYAQWLSRKTGRQYRLPTEGEWAFAAEVGGRSGAADDKHMQACVYANVSDALGEPQAADSTWVVHTCTDGYSYSAPVRDLPPNALGLYDMAGNNWEWTQDCQEQYTAAPTDGTPKDSRECRNNVLRGGSWYMDTQLARNSYRIWLQPAVRNFSYGFRLASSLQ